MSVIISEEQQKEIARVLADKTLPFRRDDHTPEEIQEWIKVVTDQREQVRRKLKGENPH